MPVIIPEQLPATRVLKDHGIFVMTETRAKTQDIRPVKICILNLMPDKITTETQLLSKLSNGVLQVEITLLTMSNHLPKNTKQAHLDSFYSYFADIKDQYFDGMVITGAPIEHLEFEEVTYWEELKEIFDWSRTHVFSTLFICWASQAALYHFYGIGKAPFPKKLSGVYEHQKEDALSRLLIGMDDLFYVPHSRNTQSDPQAIRQHPNLKVVASSEKAGLHLVASQNERELYMSGHPEYDVDTLQKEYLRDRTKGDVDVPENYFVRDDPEAGIQTRWMSHASTFYQNWLNYFVYQETDYEFTSRSQEVIALTKNTFNL